MNRTQIFLLALVLGALGVALLTQPEEPTLNGFGFRPIRSGFFDTEVAVKFLEDELEKAKAHRSADEGALEFAVLVSWEYDRRGDPRSVVIELICACPEGRVYARGAAPGISRMGWFSKHDETLAAIAARAVVRDLARQLARTRKKNALLVFRPAPLVPGLFLTHKKRPSGGGAKRGGWRG